MYLLQLVQALKYENFDDIKNGLEPTKKDSQGSGSESLSNSGISSADVDRYGSSGKIIFTCDTLSLFTLFLLFYLYCCLLSCLPSCARLLLF